MTAEALPAGLEGVTVASSGGPTLVSITSELLRGSEWTWRLSRGKGAKPSHVARHLGARLISAHWGTGPGPAPSPRSRVTGEQEEHARAVLEVLVPLISSGLDDHLAIVELALTLLAEAGLSVTATHFSEPGLIAIGNHLVEHPGVPIDRRAHAEALVTLIQRRGGGLPADEFYRTQFDRYRALWETTGTVSVRQSPPSKIALGSDERPPLVALGVRRSWMSGTDRAVYDRYKLCFDDRRRPSRIRDHGRRPAQVLASQADDATLPGDSWLPPDPVAIAEREVVRTCRGYGLTERAHRRILVTLSQVQLDSSASASQALGQLKLSKSMPPAAPEDVEDEAEDDAEVTADAELGRAVSAKLRLWANTSHAWSLRETHGNLDGFHEHLNWVLVRATWMGLLRREQMGEPVAALATVLTLLGPTLDHKFPEAVRRWSGIAARDAWSDRRHNQACELMATLTAHAPGLVRPRGEAAADAAFAAYEKAAENRHGVAWREVVLTVDELADFLSGYLITEEEW